jgi:hypothetical protein
MARQALFPETNYRIDSPVEGIVDVDDEVEIDNDDDELDALLATLASWSSKGDEDNKTNKEDSFRPTSVSGSSAHEESLADELQEWRKKHSDDSPFSNWSEEDKTAFDGWVKNFVIALVPDAALQSVDLEETKKNLLIAPPQPKESANEFWSQLRDETAAEMFLRNLLEAKEANKGDHPFWNLDYQTQVRRLVHLGTIREIANEYATEADRSKFLSRYGDYLVEGIQFDHLIPHPNGPIVGSDLGEQLLAKYNIKPSDRFVLRKLSPNEEGASNEARSLYQAWNKLKAGRANYEEKLFNRGLLGLSYEATKKGKKL